jgi:antitoxin (DNA-binding transcriptional repressor) of toxin-antitoxin stability system
MKIIGIRELKDRLSEVIRRARREGPVLVSNRGEIVAELRAPYGVPVREKLDPGLAALAEQGRLRLGAPRGIEPYPVLEPLLPEGSAARLLDEDRGGR